MKKRLFLALCTSLFILTAVGQDFRGVIVNAKHRPLKGMMVVYIKKGGSCYSNW